MFATKSKVVVSATLTSVIGGQRTPLQNKVHIHQLVQRYNEGPNYASVAAANDQRYLSPLSPIKQVILASSFHSTSSNNSEPKVAENLKSSGGNDNGDGIVWTTHRLTQDQLLKVDKIFHKVLWLDMFEIHQLNEIVKERLSIRFTPKQKRAMFKKIKKLNLDGDGSGASDGSANAEADAAAAAAAAAEAAAPKTVELRLVGFDEKSKIKVIKEVRAIASLGLKEAKELVEGAPKAVLKDISIEKAEELQKKLEAAGAKIELV